MNRIEWLATGMALTMPVLAGWLAPSPPTTSRAAPVAEIPWTLPSLPPVDAARLAYERLRARQPAAVAGQPSIASGGEAGNAAPLLADGDWRLRGVVQADGQRYALIETAAGKTRRYRAGDTLPRGETLRAIRPDRIEISHRETIETRVLYRGDQPRTGKP
jgi:Type II secretion system protein C